MENLTIAEEYYNALGQKNVDAMEKYLSEEVHLISPLAEISGSKAVLDAARQLASIFNTLEIRAKFASGDQVMMAHTLYCPEPMGEFRSSVLLTFKDELITKIELFYDARPIEALKKQIFEGDSSD